MSKWMLQCYKPDCSSLPLLPVEVQALGPGLGLAPSFNIILGSWLAYGFLCRRLQRANVVLAVQCSYFWLGGSLCHCGLVFLCNKNKPSAHVSTSEKR